MPTSKGHAGAGAGLSRGRRADPPSQFGITCSVGEHPTRAHSPCQAKLLRVLESREVMRVGARQLDVRFRSATNVDLGDLVNRGGSARTSSIGWRASPFASAPAPAPSHVFVIDTSLDCENAHSSGSQSLLFRGGGRGLTRIMVTVTLSFPTLGAAAYLLVRRPASGAAVVAPGRVIGGAPSRHQMSPDVRVRYKDEASSERFSRSFSPPTSLVR
jgi:hypothetical protein